MTDYVLGPDPSDNDDDYPADAGNRDVDAGASSDDADQRTRLVAAAQAGWIDALTDLGGRNTLLYYKDHRSRTRHPVPGPTFPGLALLRPALLRPARSRLALSRLALSGLILPALGPPRLAGLRRMRPSRTPLTLAVLCPPDRRLATPEPRSRSRRRASLPEGPDSLRSSPSGAGSCLPAQNPRELS